MLERKQRFQDNRSLISTSLSSDTKLSFLSTRYQAQIPSEDEADGEPALLSQPHELRGKLNKAHGRSPISLLWPIRPHCKKDNVLTSLGTMTHLEEAKPD